MELAQNYVYMVYRLGSFSKAAEKLFISQPSLSATVKKLERELGFLIFDRRSTPLQLTIEGKIYIEYLEEIRENERIMLSRVESLAEKQREELIVGSIGIVARTVLPKICKEFLKSHSDVNLRLDFGDDMPLLSNVEKIEHNRMNIALEYTYNDKIMNAIPLATERYFLAFTRECPGTEELIPFAVGIYEVLSEKRLVADKRIYNIIPDKFTVFRREFHTKSGELEAYVNKITRPVCRVVNSRHRGIYYDLMLMGIGATFVTDIIAATEKERSRDVFFIPIEHGRTLYAIYKKGRALNKSEEDFIALLREAFNKPKNEMF